MSNYKGNFTERTLDGQEILNGHSVRIDTLLGFSIPSNDTDRFRRIWNILFNYNQEFDNETERFMFKSSKLLWLKWCNLKHNSKTPISVGDEVISIRGGFGNRCGGILLEVTEVDPHNDRVCLRRVNSKEEYLISYNNWFLSLLKI